MRAGKIVDVRALDVLDEGEGERLGWAVEESRGWFAFSAHPLRDHPLIGTFPTARAAYRAILAAEEECDRTGKRDDLAPSYRREVRLDTLRGLLAYVDAGIELDADALQEIIGEVERATSPIREVAK